MQTRISRKTYNRALIIHTCSYLDIFENLPTLVVVIADVVEKVLLEGAEVRVHFRKT